MTKRKTIKLSGKDYVQVAERIRAIHSERKDTIDVETTYFITENGNVVFTATLSVEVVNANKSLTSRKFTAHSFGKLGGAKAFEKLETVAVGRALAFAGYHGDGDIASADEMESFEQEIDYEKIEAAQVALNEAKTLDELQKVYQKLERAVKGNKDVIATKDARKKELASV